MLEEESEAIEWTKKEKLEFRVTQLEAMACEWGQNRKIMKNNYLTVDSLRCAIGAKKTHRNNPISKVKGEDMVYRFSCNMEKLVGFNPCLSVLEENCFDVEKLFGFELELNSQCNLFTEGPVVNWGDFE